MTTRKPKTPEEAAARAALRAAYAAAEARYAEAVRGLATGPADYDHPARVAAAAEWRAATSAAQRAFAAWRKQQAAP